MINTALQQSIEALIQENQTLSHELESVNFFLEKENIENYDLYRNHSLMEILVKDTKSMIGVFIIAIIVIGISSIFGLGPFLLAILALIFIISYFKQVIVYLIIIYFLSSIHSDIAIILMLISTILLIPACRYPTLVKRQKSIENYDRLTHALQINHDKIIQISTPPVIDLLHQEQTVDVNSLQENGLSFLPAQYINEILEKQVNENNAEKLHLPQTDKILYKSKQVNINEQMTSISLEID